MRLVQLRVLPFLALALSAGTALLPTAARGDIYVLRPGDPNNPDFPGAVSVYTNSGAIINPTLITGVWNARGLAVSEAGIFITNQDTGTISQYTTSGALVNAALVSGLNRPGALAISGSNLYVALQGTGSIGEYTTWGDVAGAWGTQPFGIPANLFGTLSAVAVSGSNVYALDASGVMISSAPSSGSMLDGPLNTRSSYPLRWAWGVAASESNVFVTDIVRGTVAEYTDTLDLVNPALISGLANPQGIAVSGSNLYVMDSSHGIGEYTFSGVPVNASLIPQDWSFFAVTDAVPLPGAFWSGLALLGGVGVPRLRGSLGRLDRRRRAGVTNVARSRPGLVVS